MIEENPEIQAQVDALFDVYAAAQRGDVIPHEVVDRITGDSTRGPRWRHVDRSARNAVLKELKIATWVEHKVGFRLLTKDETLTWLPQKRRDKAENQCRKLVRELRNMPVDELTDHQRKVRLAALAAARARLKAIKDESLAHEVVCHVAETLPRYRHRPAVRPAFSLS